ncbi:myrosinase 1-like, partial [Cydia splendana]|uniref:myrosinase 1-like n=1 Tax=Cydia splendana TaxID=1100963 RepID=UPI00300CF094
FSLSVAVLGFTDRSVRRFKDGFLFGAATAAYQVEGAWNEDGKGKSVWDHIFHSMLDEESALGDVASDSYHNYKRDVEMLRELGVDVYRFSISWPRVLPEGFSNIKNEPGLQYYDNLIDELLKYNIQPMVTIYHFDLPKVLLDLGGWSNPYSVQWFEDYARMLFDRYASKVKYWTTMNQPTTVCEVEMKVRGNLLLDYVCAKNLLLAHARTYRMYEKEYKKIYGGSVGISTAVNWVEPVTNSTENVEAAEIYKEFTYGMYLDPIWSKNGDFPRLVKDRVAKKSKEQGFPRSRLPSLSKDEIELIKGSSDFLGLNHYTTYLTSPSKGSHPVPSFADDVSVDTTTGREKWTQSRSAWLKSKPDGLYKVCLLLNKRYDYPLIFVTENGWSTDKGLQAPRRNNNDDTPVKISQYASEEPPSVPPVQQGAQGVLPAPHAPTGDSQPQDLAEELRRFRADFSSMRNEIAGVRQELAELHNSFNNFNARIELIEDRVKRLEDRVEDEQHSNPGHELAATVAELKMELADRDQDLLSNDLEITGIPELPNESPYHLLSLVAQKLGVSLDEREIIFAERVGVRRHLQEGTNVAAAATGSLPAGGAAAASEPASGTASVIAAPATVVGNSRPRPLVVRLARRGPRSDLLRAARVRRGADTADFDLPGQPSRFYVNERLTKLNRERFGLYEVDFDSPERTRTARQSALVYKRIIQKRVVEEGWKPKNLKITVSKVKTEL